MKTPTLLFLSLFAITLLSCSSSDDSTTEPDIVVDPDPDPIPGQTSTYTAHVKTIIDTNCIECHGDPLNQGAVMMLLTYDQVVDAINNRGLFDRIDTNNAFNVMPESGRMPQATIDVVKDWIADGLLE